MQRRSWIANRLYDDSWIEELTRVSESGSWQGWFGGAAKDEITHIFPIVPSARSLILNP